MTEEADYSTKEIRRSFIMMRSLYSGVSGLKSHQTRMDVIGNNIANVNTTAYKAKTINFSDMLYQTTQAATGPNIENGTAGTNARQIGLGVKTGAINTSITTEGATQSTGNPFDLKLSGEAFFIVSDGSNTYFTRDGSFNVDAAGYLCMGNNGYTVMGWTNIDADTGAIIQDSVKPLQILSPENQVFPAAATTSATISGIVDKFDDNLLTEYGRMINVQTYDNLGYEYNLKFGIKPVTNAVTSDKYVTNTEKLYNLPGSIELVDNSEITFFKADGTEIKVTGLPSDLLQALEDKAKETYAPNGTEQSVNVLIDDAFLNAYNITDLGAASTLKGENITVTFSGETGYMAYKEKGGSGTTGNVELGIIDLPDDVITALYGTVPATVGDSYDLAATVENGLLVTEKAYTDGTDTKYLFHTTDGTKTEIELNYTDVARLLATDGTPEVQAQYTTTEETTVDETIDGQYTISLLSMTDADGQDMNIDGISDKQFNLVYNTDNGKFSYVGAEGNTAFTLNLSALGNNFSDVKFDMSTTTNVDNGNKSTVSGLKDDGRKVGVMTGVSIGTDGVITANYSNGQSKTIAQIAVATFANAMGLSNEGDNLYAATANSGDFDGVGVDIKASGTGYMTTGVLEMSNVDLSQQFTDMITTQRGFQANSRIITVSDTLLEELVNLKR